MPATASSSTPIAARRAIGYLPESPPLYPEMTVGSYLAYVARIKDVPRAERRAAVDRALERTALTDVRRRVIGTLSRGFRQRVGLAQAIVHNPPVLILDEPTAGLDPLQIREIRALICELGKEHGIILSTHILPEVQATCNRVQIINRGQLVFSDSTAGLEQRMNATALIAGFHTAPDVTALQQLPGVDSVEPLADNRVRIHFHDSNPAEAVIEQSVSKRWQLHELTPERRTLEQIFIELTCSEEHATITGDAS